MNIESCVEQEIGREGIKGMAVTLVRDIYHPETTISKTCSFDELDESAHYDLFLNRGGGNWARYLNKPYDVIKEILASIEFRGTPYIAKSRNRTN